MLNHLIDELLPARADGYRYSNSDPVTGQAAWFDLRVKLEKASPDQVGISQPQFGSLPLPPGVPKRPDHTAFGETSGTKP